MMDIPRPEAARRRRIRRAAYAGVGVFLLAGITAAISRLEPAAPSVERGAIWWGTVERGSMTREVRGTGRLVPEEIRLIPAATSGRVERIRLQPGALVQPDTIVLELFNAELEQELFDALSQWKQSQAELSNLRVQLDTLHLDQEVEAARVASESELARLQAEADQELSRDGLVSSLTARVSAARAESLATQSRLESQRLQMLSVASRAQLEARQEQVDQRQAFHRLKLAQIESLQVRAGIRGVLQEITVEVGQQVTPGANLARVAEPERLKAQVRVAATQARDLLVGQPASVDTRNTVIPGRVSRIDPAVQEGLVAVDIQLTGALPRGARPDLPVDGTIELEHLENIFHMPRPVFGQENATVSLFRLEPDRTHARRVQVKLGRISVSRIEVLEGLTPGDEITLSDMSRWDEHERIRLE